VRIHQLTLATGDIARQSAFWGKTLGLPVREGADDAIEIALQASMIRFEQASPGTDPRYHFAINVPRGSIQHAAAWIDERHELLAFHGDPVRRRAQRSRTRIAAPRRSTSSTPPATSRN
jgi:catechol 2,3-dioxygenase-like lactoylglutathione lyase family enzyme